MNITFRPLARSDFALLAGWLRTPHVARWWADDPSPAALEAGYGACIDGHEASFVYIALLDGLPFGLIQRYRWGTYPAYLQESAHIMAVDPLASSIDYLVGPPGLLGRGLGSALIRAFVDKVWHDDPATPGIVVPVQADNAASWRALERAGFSRVAQGLLEPDNPADRWDHVIYAKPAPTSRPA